MDIRGLSFQMRKLSGFCAAMFIVVLAWAGPPWHRGVVVPPAASSVPADINNADLQLWYKFDEGSGTTLTDSSQYGRTGTVTATNGYPAWTTIAKFGPYALTNITISEGVAYSPSFKLTNVFSISVWQMINSGVTSYGRIVENSYASGFMVSQQGANQFFGCTMGLTGVSTAGGSGVPYVWYNLIYTFNNGTATLYTNGVLVGTASLSNPGVVSLPVYIGMPPPADGGGNKASGPIDDLRIYSRVISSADIAWLQTNP